MTDHCCQLLKFDALTKALQLRSGCIMTLTEEDVGIVEFLGDHKPFHAVLKKYIDDFIVKEVRLDGSVTHLTSTSLSDNAESEEPSAIKSATTELDGVAKDKQSNDEESLESNVNYSALDGIFKASSSPVRNEVKAIVESNLKEFTFPPISDKALRKALHGWVRENLGDYITDTVDMLSENTDKPQQAVRMRRRDAFRPWKRRRKGDTSAVDASRDDTFDPRDSGASRRKAHRISDDPLYVDRKTYVSFVLWKRDKDTNEAILAIAKVLKLNPNHLTHAGTKDKRAVTTQAVRVRGVPVQRLASINKASAMYFRGRRSIALGNFETLSGDENKPLSLGDLKGNRFTLVLRDISLGSPEEKLNILTSIDNVKTRGFINYFGLQRFGSGVSPTHETGYAVLRGDFKEACERILTPLIKSSLDTTDNVQSIPPERKEMIECLQAFAKKRITAVQLLEKLPKWMTIERKLAEGFAHDERCGHNKYDYKSAFGKLPRNLKKMYGHAVQSYLWNRMASKRISMFAPDSPWRRFAAEGDLVLQNHSDAKLNYETNVRPLTAEEAQKQEITIDKVLLPVIGTEVPPPDTTVGNVAKKILTSEGIDMGNVPPEYSMKGTYRWLVCKPEDVETSFKTYNATDRRPLVPVDVPTPGIEVPKTMDQASKVAVDDSATSLSAEPNGADSRVALIASFTLGCASYATMFARELMQSSDVSHGAGASKATTEQEVDKKDPTDIAFVGKDMSPAALAKEGIVSEDL